MKAVPDGEVLSRITNDVDTLGQGLNQSITQIITSTATIIGVLIMMLSISPLMTLIACVILPISMTLISLVVKKSQKYFKTQQEYLGHINGQVEEVYGGHMVIKVYNKEEETVEEFEKTNRVLYDSAWKSQFLSGMMQPIMMFVGNLGYAAVALAGGLLAIRNVITIGDIQAFHPVCKEFYAADHADRAGSQSGCSPWRRHPSVSLNSWKRKRKISLPSIRFIWIRSRAQSGSIMYISDIKKIRSLFMILMLQM